MYIRTEQPGDMPAIQAVNEAAFGRPDEAHIVAALHARDAVILSLVAEVDDQVVGHILFSPVIVEGEQERFEAVGMGPVAVLPDYQNQAIGTQLCRQGIERCREAGHSIMVVLGHPNYYPRFGFQPAKQLGLWCTYDVPDDVYMALELQSGALNGRGGTVHYQPEFG